MPIVRLSSFELMLDHLGVRKKTRVSTTQLHCTNRPTFSEPTLQRVFIYGGSCRNLRMLCSDQKKKKHSPCPLLSRPLQCLAIRWLLRCKRLTKNFRIFVPCFDNAGGRPPRLYNIACLITLMLSFCQNPMMGTHFPRCVGTDCSRNSAHQPNGFRDVDPDAYFLCFCKAPDEDGALCSTIATSVVLLS